mmetsp:Transcript_15042/g.25024  ORF Transcript_15042/g.25024 Transcript_15042/m.25024 type:complete len:217 (-) Transcript_15042:307-957(-)
MLPRARRPMYLLARCTVPYLRRVAVMCDPPTLIILKMEILLWERNVAMEFSVVYLQMTHYCNQQLLQKVWGWLPQVVPSCNALLSDALLRTVYCTPQRSIGLSCIPLSSIFLVQALSLRQQHRYRSDYLNQLLSMLLPQQYRYFACELPLQDWAQYLRTFHEYRSVNTQYSIEQSHLIELLLLLCHHKTIRYPKLKKVWKDSEDQIVYVPSLRNAS